MKEFAMLMGCLLLGTLAKKITGLPIPEAVFGMIFLFVLFVTKLLKTDDVGETSDFLTSILAFLFIPLGVSLMVQYEVIKDSILFIILLMMISCTVTMALTSKIVEAIQKARRK